MAYKDKNDPRALESRMKWYRENKEKVAERTRRVRVEMREYVNSLKTEPCSDCYETFPACAMDFDHVGDDKEADVSRLIHLGSWTKLKEEIAKCELVCAVCHRIRTEHRRVHPRVLDVPGALSVYTPIEYCKLCTHR